jgi:hypothetical protein
MFDEKVKSEAYYQGYITGIESSLTRLQLLEHRPYDNYKFRDEWTDGLTDGMWAQNPFQLVGTQEEIKAETQKINKIIDRFVEELNPILLAYNAIDEDKYDENGNYIYPQKRRTRDCIAGTITRKLNANFMPQG